MEFYKEITQPHFEKNNKFYTEVLKKEAGGEISDEELKKGVETEKEHLDLYNKIHDYLKTKKITMPLSKKQFFEYIAKAHLNEISNYYELLDEMEKKAKNKTKKMETGDIIKHEKEWEKVKD